MLWKSTHTSRDMEGQELMGGWVSRRCLFPAPLCFVSCLSPWDLCVKLFVFFFSWIAPLGFGINIPVLKLEFNWCGCTRQLLNSQVTLCPRMMFTEGPEAAGSYRKMLHYVWLNVGSSVSEYGSIWTPLLASLLLSNFYFWMDMSNTLTQGCISFFSEKREWY